MIICKTYAELKNALNAKKQGYAQGDAQGYVFVPTMGNLHAGHLSLVQQAAAEAKKNGHAVIVSIFVNPTQFAPHEDFGSYPRTLESDLELLTGQGVEIVYAPRVEDIYPQISTMKLDIPHLTQCLCGKSRPHFFSGVMTVLLKFYLQIQPKIMILGEKDYQQFMVVREMASCLNLEMQVISGAIIRDAEGLALSSRNGYLSPQELTKARQINKILQKAGQLQRAGQLRSANEMVEFCKAELENVVEKLDYLEIRSNKTLELANPSENPENCRIFFAGLVGKTRLIDNMLI